MTVSKMTALNAPLAAELEAKLFSHPWREKDFLTSLSDESRCFLTAMEGERLLGYCGLQVGGDQGDVLTIGVDPALRRQGIGQTLLNQLVKEGAVLGVKELFLEVRAGNHGARALYEKTGFRSVGKRPRYYRDPEEDGVIYVLEVQE